jgi:antagonist of KipI
MDRDAFHWANLLVGNLLNRAYLGICMLGPTLAFQSSVTFTICGAHLSPRLNGSPISG